MQKLPAVLQSVSSFKYISYLSAASIAEYCNSRWIDDKAMPAAGRKLFWGPDEQDAQDAQGFQSATGVWENKLPACVFGGKALICKPVPHAGE